MPILSTKISSLGGVYKRYSTPLEKLGIITLKDFLFHIPFRYDDYTLTSKISNLQPGEVVTIRGQVLEMKNQYVRRFTIQKAKIKDETGEIEAVWFNQPYIAKNITQDDFISLSGKVEQKGPHLQLSNPDFEIGRENFIHTGRLVPVYPETRGVTSKWLRRQVYKILSENKEELTDFLPTELIKENKLEDLSAAISQIHFPNNLEEIDIAKKRLAFDELLLIQLSSNLRRKEWDKELKGESFDLRTNKKKLDEFIKTLPFELTNAQKRSVDEILLDLSKEKPMNRLLEGDVGSGKTVVAAIAIYLSHLSSFQSVFMAPTEILATQHFKTLSSLLEPMGLVVAISTGSKKEKIEKFDVLVGTHAVLSDKINYKKLGLLVIDEQQRFGVEQRALMREKGKNPHVLTMTATPIPRTIALTMYGDLDLSILDEMPKGRKEIKTWLVPNAKREAAYTWMKEQIDKNKSQAFIVCPFIEESESMTSVRAATKEFERLQKVIFKKYKLALLHGKIKSKDKDQTLTDFRNEKYNILVATPVVEVGIDIPNADIILIEASERFGLSQLHQLRGRVGRNDRQAYCLLFTEAVNPLTKQRLVAMTKTNIGAELAELDLKLRGPGEIYGTIQHGRRFLKVADFSDFELIKKTKNEAEKLAININKYPKLLEKVAEINTKAVSPD